MFHWTIEYVLFLGSLLAAIVPLSYVAIMVRNEDYIPSWVFDIEPRPFFLVRTRRRMLGLLIGTSLLNIALAIIRAAKWWGV